ncbi:MAG: Uma2 family endonuclease [Lewinellaceae bacterium]|nr:Uma2 family endonuclease [Saprospiraceae bacterium]MCB9337161.1 Uma2 family endonuclease [Lewinellaceae bacterium]
MVAFAQKRYTKEEYLDFEMKSKIRHEFVNGKIVPMPYTTKSHGRIAQNLSRLIGNCLHGTHLEVFQENRMLHVPSCENFYYPDLIIVPIKVETFTHKQKMEADLYPVALVEVASASTEDYDKEEKWRCYQQIKSLQQYILVSQASTFVQVYTRQKENVTKWVYTSYQTPDDKVPVMNCEIPVQGIYDRVIFLKPEHKSNI